MLEQNSYFLLQLKLIIKCRVKSSVIIHQQRFVHRVLKVYKIKHLNRNAVLMPVMNTLSSFTHLNEACFHLLYWHSELSLSRSNCGMVVFIDIYVTSLKFSWLESCAKTAGFCSVWASGNLSHCILRNSEGSPAGKAQSTVNCRLVCGRLRSCEEVRNNLLLIKGSCDLAQPNGSEVPDRSQCKEEYMWCKRTN